MNKKPKKFNWILFFVTFFVIASLLAIGFGDRNKSKNEEVNLTKFIQIIEANAGKEKLSITEMSEGEVVLVVGDKKDTSKETKTYVTTVNPRESQIPQLIEKHDIEYDFVFPQSIGGLIFNFIFYGFFLVLLWFMVLPMFKNRQIGSEAHKDVVVPKVTFEDIGGLTKETKAEILHNLETQKNPDAAKSLGVRQAKGLLLYGPSGTGKTLIAKAIANTFNYHFISADGSSFVEMFAGLGAKRVRDLFQKAKKHQPCVIFIDEIDAVGKKRSGQGQFSNDEREQTLNQLLILLDGIESNNEIFVVAATNRHDILDDALLRPGRFDYKVKIDLPSPEGRKEIINIHTKNKPLSQDVISRIDEISESTIGFSGADIEDLFSKAAYNAFVSGRNEIIMEDVNFGLDRIVLGSDTQRAVDKETKRKTAYHEAGHAAISIMTNKPIRKATIVPRGDALGFVAHIPKEGNMTRSELLDHLKMMVAGGVTEAMVFGEHSTGISDDFKRAKELIGQMVEDWGMGTVELTPTFSKKEKERQMLALYESAITGCRKLLSDNREFLDDLAELLYRKETLDGAEISDLYNKHCSKPE